MKLTLADSPSRNLMDVSGFDDSQENNTHLTASVKFAWPPSVFVKRTCNASENEEIFEQFQRLTLWQELKDDSMTAWISKVH